MQVSTQIFYRLRKEYPYDCNTDVEHFAAALTSISHHAPENIMQQLEDVMMQLAKHQGMNDFVFGGTMLPPMPGNNGPDTVLDAVYGPGYGEDFVPTGNDAFHSTDAIPGTMEKLDVMAERIANGQPLFHEGDRESYDEVISSRR